MSEIHPSGMSCSRAYDTEGTPHTRAGSSRLLALDVFRGITIAAMVLVNNPGSWSHVYAPLEHAAWHGWTPTDLIFPFFIFILGVAMTYSLGKALEQGTSRTQLLLKVAQRATAICIVGLALHGFICWSYGQPHLRLPGVLQRIGIVYLVAAGIYLYAGIRGQIAVVTALLLGYWGLQTLVPIPGGRAGVLEPGQDLGAYLDRAIFTTEHLWQQSRTWDPEGLLSTLPAIATALLGACAGTWLRSNRMQFEKVAGLFVMGSAGIVAGLVWDGLLPINKNLWTSSYVMFTAGLASHILAICYYLVDLKGGVGIQGGKQINAAERKRYRMFATPFVIYGSNAIAAYVLSSGGSVVLDTVKLGDGGDLKSTLFTQLYLSWLDPLDASLLFAITYTLLWLAIMAVLYKKRIFIKL